MSDATPTIATPTAPSDSLEFCLRLNRAYATLTRRLDNALSSVHGLRFGDFMILSYLDRAPPVAAPSTAERLEFVCVPTSKNWAWSRQTDLRDHGWATSDYRGRPAIVAIRAGSVEPIGRR
jgi:hypothetical protein